MNKTMKNRISLTLIFFLFTIIINAQYSKSDLKRLKRLKKKHDFISVNYRYLDKSTNCSNVIVGEYSKSPSDRGGNYSNGVKKLKKIDLKGKVIESISNYNITLPFSDNHKKYKNLIRIKSNINGKVGLMDNCGTLILTPTYDHINAFNEEGFAVCFKGNFIQIINTKGEPVLKEMKPYDVDYNSFWTIPTPGRINRLKIIGKSIVISDSKVYAVYDIEKKINLTKFEYSDIEFDDLINFGDKKYFKAKRNEKHTLIDIETGKELIPPVFYEIDNIIKDNNEYFVVGKANNHKNYNRYNIEKKSFVFPLDVEFSEAKKIKGFNDKWVVTNHSNGWSRGIYDTTQKKYLINLNSDISNISSRPLNNAVKIDYNNTTNDISKLYDLTKSEFMSLKVGKKYDPKKIVLKAEGKEVMFLNYSFQPNPRSTLSKYNIIYDNNWNIIVENIRVRGLKTRGDIFYFYEIINNQRKYTAYNILGELIGEKRNFIP